MAICKECSSEINDNDAFCPFCGIAIVSPEEPAAEESESNADLMDSTIVISKDEFANFTGFDPNQDAASLVSGQEDIEPISNEVSEELPASIADADLPESAITESGSINEPLLDNTSEPDMTSNTDSDVFEAPLPQILEDTFNNFPIVSAETEIEETASHTSKAPETEFDTINTENESANLENEPGIPVADFSIDLPIVEEPKSNEAVQEEPINFDPDPSEKSEFALESVNETQEKEIPTNDQEEIVYDGLEGSSELIDESAISIVEEPEVFESLPVAETPTDTEPQTATDTTELIDNEPEISAQVSTEQTSETLSVDESAKTTDADDWNDLEWGDEPVATAEESIAEDVSDTTPPLAIEEKMITMPNEELKHHDPFEGDPTFDSVRIIHNEDDPPLEPIEPGIKAIEPAVTEPETTAAEDTNEEIESVASATKAKDTGSENDPKNESDTGRGKSKLKPLPEGVVLNSRYEIIRKIGGGGMGAVYLASDNNLGGVLRAVKEMIQSHIEEQQQDKAVDDFKRESMILSSLDHPSIPTIFDYFYDEAESRFYLVMKYISGGDLSTRLRSSADGRIEEEVVTDWALQIIDVLDYLHNQPAPIVYRDLKPSNIMLDGNSGRVMLIDFGIARSISQKEEKGVTAVGTMGYAPPELFSGNVEPRSDIYSLGSTMFHMLTGADPQSNPLLIFDFQKNPRPRQINPRLSDQIERILMKAVEYNAEARFASAKEMRDVLSEHLKSLRSGKLSFGVSAVPESVSLANQSVFCGFCGQKIVATDLFCAFCGSKQPIAQQGVQSGIYSGATATARLLIEGTTELSTPMFSLQKNENLVGRRDPMSNIFPEVDLSKYDPQTKISRRHARIWRDANDFLVEDLGSSNGTIVNTTAKDSLRLLPHQPQKLNNGDRIIIGDTTMQFVVN